MLGSLGWASAVAAQSSVLVVAGKGLSADAQRTVAAAISDVAELADSHAYVVQARKRKLQPASDAALREVAPRLRVNLIVVARREHGKLTLSYRDGQSAELLGEDRFPMPRRGKRDARLHQQLAAAVNRALGGAAPAPSRAAAPAARAAEPEPEEPEEPEQEPPSPPPPAAAERAAEPRAEAESGLESGAESPAAAEPVSADSEPAERMHAALGVGPGLAGRAIELPTREGTRSLSTGLHPGLALSLSAHGMIGSHFRLAAAGNYRTSFGLSGVETPPLDTQRKTSLRSHSLGFGLAPGYRFGAAGSVVLQLHLGWMFQGLRSVVDLAFPSVSWHGLVIRPELIIPIANGALSLRLAPEVVAVAGISTTLVGRTGLASSGLGLGGELALDVRLAGWLQLGFEYRESHMSLGTSWGADVTDVVRTGSVRLILQY